MRRERAQFGHLFRVKHGYAFKGEFFDEAGPYALLTPGNFNEQGGFRDQREKQKYYTGDVPEGFVLKQGDLIVAMTEQMEGLLGSSAIIPASHRYLHNQRLGLVVELDEHRLDRRYLYHLFNTRDVRHQISSSASGTKVRHTAPERIARVEVELPSQWMQRRTADILSSYDELIENSRRRMVLLEEAARLLYREWFVRLRFPGHEHTRVANGVPSGWERAPFESALVLQRGFDLPTQSRHDGDVPIYGSTGVLDYHTQAKVSGPGVVTGRSGTLGEVHYAPSAFWPLNTALWVKEFRRLNPRFAVLLLREMDLKQYNGGASVPTLDRKAVHRIEILIPPERLLVAFDDIVAPIFEQLTKLTLMNVKLRAARDLLLPRLMSGEITL
jgi:type I restriction enzyme S subunit